MYQKLINIYKAGVYSVQPGRLIRHGIKNIPPHVTIFGNTFNNDDKFHVVGFGKAVIEMASEVQNILQNKIVSGVISAPVSSHHNLKQPFKVLYGAKNNLPDADAVTATCEILNLVKNIPPTDVVLVLISGGGSALFVKPVNGISLDEKINVIKLLVIAGADICELNTVRKKLSAVKGGGLGELLINHRTICLYLSDVIGDPPEMIASGPTVFNTDSTCAALDVIKKYKLELKIPKHVLRLIANNYNNFSKQLTNTQNICIGNNEIALKGAKYREETDSCKIVLLTSTMQGLVADVASYYKKVALCILQYLHNNMVKEQFVFVLTKLLLEKNCDITTVEKVICAANDPKIEMFCLLFGGETTVQLYGNGKGGRNQELSVLFAKSLIDLEEEHGPFLKNWDAALLCGGTDGYDGPTDSAGAIGCKDLIKKGVQAGLNVENYLAINDTYNYLSQIDNGNYLIKTGLSGTNVMDMHILAFIKKVKESNK